MHKKIVKVSDLKLGYQRSGFENATHLDYLGVWTGNQNIFVDNTIGLVRSERLMTSLDVANYWSNKIFTSSNNMDYSGKYPFAKARLLYVLLTILEYRNQGDQSINSLCDFATGEGYFLEHCKIFAPDIKLVGTETSADLVKLLKNKGFNVYVETLGESNLNFSVDIGVISWTLCNCVDAYKVLLDIRKNINEGGLLCVADSSRLMSPYRKSLKDYFSPWHPLDVHPYYFSYKSLTALLYLTGFELVYTNKYFDSDVLCLIAKKIDMPSDENLVEVDAPESVMNFMEMWHKQSQVFETYRN